MQFYKEDMNSLDYHWNDEIAKQLFFDQPSRRLFDRYNGNQVLFLINCFAAEHPNFTRKTGQFIEASIINGLPIGTRSEISVFNWLKELDYSFQKTDY